MRLHHLHHIHQRKRVHQKLAPYPHPHPWINFLDRLLLVIAIIGPWTTLPQIYKIFVEKSAAGIAITTWSLYALFAIPWLIYGIVHKDKPIMISSVLWFVTDGIVIVGGVLYA